MDWFLYDNGLRHERVKDVSSQFFLCSSFRTMKLFHVDFVENSNIRVITQEGYY